MNIRYDNTTFLELFYHMNKNNYKRCDLTQCMCSKLINPDNGFEKYIESLIRIRKLILEIHL